MKAYVMKCRIAATLAMLAWGAAALAQFAEKDSVVKGRLSTGGEVAGGYLWKSSHLQNERLKHVEGKGNVWLGYKGRSYDWRLSVMSRYKDLDALKGKIQLQCCNVDDAVLGMAFTKSNNKPFCVTTRYDFNWQKKSGAHYSLWAQYDYEHVESKGDHLAASLTMRDEVMLFVRTEDRNEAIHETCVGYRGSTPLNGSGATLNSSAEVMYRRKKVDDAWTRAELNLCTAVSLCPTEQCVWEMHPDYSDYLVKAELSVTDTLRHTAEKGLIIEGGVRFKTEGQHFRHEVRLHDTGNPQIRVEHLITDQRAEGWRYCIEPFVGVKWRSGRWSLNGEYGLRLFKMKTADMNGFAAALFNAVDHDVLRGGSGIAHFTPLLTGRAQLSCQLNRHHRLTLTNTIANRLPSNEETVLCFVQGRDYNKVLVGNPHLKPEVKVRVALDHTLSCGAFSATTGLSAERMLNQMDVCLLPCKVAGRSELAVMTQNVAYVTTYKLSETLAWTGRRLQVSASVWKHWAHNSGIGSNFSGSTLNDRNRGWRVDAKADLGKGWRAAADFQYTGEYHTVASQKKRVWQSSTVTIEKQWGPVTMYVKASSLIDPNIRLTQFIVSRSQVELTEYRASNRLVMLGCRWALK